MSKRILVLAYKPVGGIRTYIKYVYGQLFRRFKLSLVVNEKELRDDMCAALQLPEHGFYESNGSILNFVKQSIIAIHKTKPDIIHSHGLTTGVLVGSLAKLFGKKHILTLHDVFRDKHFQGIKGVILKSLISVTFKFADVINPCGFDCKDNLILYFPGLSKHKVIPIRNGINTSSFIQVNARNLREELALGNETVLVGFFGRFMPQKGFDKLIKLVKALEKNDFVVVSFGDGGFIREEKQVIQSLGLESKFRFLPYTQDVPSAMKGVDFVVMPSRWEACPLQPMEVLTIGKPLLASQCIGTKEVTADTPTVLFEPGNISEFTEKFEQMLTSHIEKSEQFSLFSTEARQRFSVTETAKSIAKVYESI